MVCNSIFCTTLVGGLATGYERTRHLIIVSGDIVSQTPGGSRDSIPRREALAEARLIGARGLEAVAARSAGEGGIGSISPREARRRACDRRRSSRIGGHAGPSGPREHFSARAVRRVVNPAGAVLLCDASPEQLREISRQLERVLVKVHVAAPDASPRDRVRLAVNRYKPHVILENSRVLRADAQVLPGGEDTLSHRLVDALWRLERKRINRLR